MPPRHLYGSGIGCINILLRFLLPLASVMAQYSMRNGKSVLAYRSNAERFFSDSVIAGGVMK
jgi:hypothetical protein